MKLVQRLNDALQCDDKYIDKFIKSVKKNKDSCDVVWFSIPYGYPTLATHKQKCELYKKQIKKFREAGIGVSIQISNTIGHGDRMQKMDCSGLVFDGSKVGTLVGHDDTKAKIGFCWRDKIFNEYLDAVVDIYATLKPDTIWFDDDTRLTGHTPVTNLCFCNNCINEFNKINNSNYTKNELVNKIIDDEKLREKYIEFSMQGLSDMFANAAKSAHKISPNTNFGYEYTCNNFATNGNNYILDKLKKVTGKAPLVRPGGGMFDDINFFAFCYKYVMLCIDEQKIPSYVANVAPEIENTPDVVYGKSIAGTMFETALYLHSGASDMTYAMLCTNMENFSWYNEHFKEFSKRKKYFNLISNLNKNSYQSGIGIALPKNFRKFDTLGEKDFNKIMKKTFEISDDFVISLSRFLRLGIPVAYSNINCDVNFIHGDTIEFFTEDELIKLLKKPCICDGKAAEFLSNKYNAFNASIEQLPQKLRPKVTINYTDDKLNGKPNNAKFTAGYNGFSGFYVINSKTDNEKNFRALSYFDVEKKDEQKLFEGKFKFGVGDSIVETKYGAKWFISGTGFWQGVISFDRRNQIRNIAEELQNYKFNIETNSKIPALLIDRRTKDGKLAYITFVNLQVGNASPDIILNNYKGEQLYGINEMGQEKKLKILKFDDCYKVKLPKMQAFTFYTIYVK